MASFGKKLTSKFSNLMERQDKADAMNKPYLSGSSSVAIPGVTFVVWYHMPPTTMANSSLIQGEIFSRRLHTALRGTVLRVLSDADLSRRNSGSPLAEIQVRIIPRWYRYVTSPRCRGSVRERGVEDKW